MTDQTSMAPARLHTRAGRKASTLARLWSPIAKARGVPLVMLCIGTAIVLFFIALAIFAPLLAPYGFDQYQIDGVRFAKQGAPSAEHLFGTNARQTDVLSIVIYGSQTALKVMTIAVLSSIVIGVPLGLVSGYLGGWFDRIAVLVTDALFAFPSMLLAIVVAFLLSNAMGGGVLTAAISITVVYVPQYFRVVRNSVLSVREEPFVEAAIVMGAPMPTVIGRYLFSNVIQSVPIIATLNAADAILTLAGLGFLGYGIQPTVAAEWGYELQRAIPDIAAGIWWTGLFPGAAIVLLVVGLTLVGEGLNDVLNPTFRTRSLRPVAVEAAPPPSRPRQKDALLDVQDLSVWYPSEAVPVKAVDEVSFTLKKGQVLGIVGESGCGKSTLGRALLGLLPKGAGTAGLAAFQGNDLFSMSGAQRRALAGQDLAMIFQEPMTRLNPLMRVDEHFAELLRAHRPQMAAAEIRQATLDILRVVGIPGSRLHQYPHQFSGGMRQRIMIALALVLRPAFVVADEPTTALDVVVEAQILELLKRLQGEMGMGLILVTHNLGIVADSCDDVAVMYAGRIVEHGPAMQVFRNPKHPYTQGLLSATITAETTELKSIPGAPPDMTKPPAGCRFHPRCPFAMNVCTTSVPKGLTADGHVVECWLYSSDLDQEQQKRLSQKVLADAD